MSNFIKHASDSSVILERLRFEVSKQIGSGVAETVQLFVEPTFSYMGGMVLRLSAEVLAEKLADDVLDGYLPFPKSAYQLFKEQHMPAWFTKRFPVKMRRRRVHVEYKKYATYPKANIVLPKDKFGPVVIREETRLTK